METMAGRADMGNSQDSHLSNSARPHKRFLNTTDYFWKNPNSGLDK